MQGLSSKNFTKSTQNILKNYTAGALENPLTLTGHEGYVRCLTVLSDGRLVSGSNDSTIKIWDAEKGKCEATLTEWRFFGNTINCLTVLPDGRLVSSSNDGIIRIRDVGKGTCEKIWAWNEVLCLTTLPKGRLASGDGNGTIRIWDVGQGKCEATLTGHTHAVCCLTVLPDGRLASGSSDNTIKIWDAGQRKCEATLTGHTSYVRCLTVRPDGRLVSGSEDHTIKIWDVGQGKCEATKRMGWGVFSLTVLPDSRLASGSCQTSIWDSGKEKYAITLEMEMMKHMPNILCLTVLPDGRLASGSSDDIIKIWDFPVLTPALLLPTIPSPVSSVEIKPPLDIARSDSENGAKEKDLRLVAEAETLFSAITERNLDKVKKTLQQGASLTTPDTEGFFPLLRAAQAGDVSILEILIDKGAALNGKHSIHRDTGHGVLYQAALHNQFDAGIYLLSKGAKPDLLTLDEETVLHACARSGCLLLAKHLQTLGSSLDECNETNQTPLILAAIAGDEEFVGWLLDNGVQWDAIDSSNKTALDYAKENKHAAAATLLTKLKKQGGYKNFGNQESSTPPAQKQTTPPAESPILPPKETPTSSASLKTKPKSEKPALDDQGGIRVQFTIPSSALTIYKSEVLGSGGFGIVYRGLFNFSEVAIKKLHADNLSERALQEFKSESLLMGQMRHPNVIQPLGACFEPGQYSLVMELMPNKSLYDLLHNKKEISWTIRAQIAADVCAGLAYLHSQKIVHRDLKSMNVLLDGGLRAKLSDFGLATVKTETQSTTQEGAKAAGTTRWMAPELFEGEGCTFESDIFSLAWVLWEIASRQLPYPKAANDAIVINLIGKGKKEPIPADCPPEIGQVITDCWKTTPSERPGSAETSTTITAWCSLFKSESQANAGGSTRTELRELKQGQVAIQQKQEEIAAAVQLGIKLQLPPIPSSLTL
jgi:WD40 repeat protein